MKKNFLKNKSLWAIILLCAILVLVFGFHINNSNMDAYSVIIPNNVSASRMETIGKVRMIRSDEFLVSSPAFFHDHILGPFRLLWNSDGSPAQTINQIIKLINPLNWGNYFLPTEYAFSWMFIQNYLFSLAVFFALFYIITKRRNFSVVSACILCFSPGFQWWWGPVSFARIMAISVLFYLFFDTEKVWGKVLCAAGLICVMQQIVEGVYPAWDVPLVYLALFLLVGIYLTEKKIKFKKADIPYIFITTALMIIVVGVYFLSNRTAMSMELNTVYPGKRFSSGGGLFGSSYWVHYLAMLVTPWKELTFSWTNLSEISSFLHLFPVPYILYFLKRKDLKSNKIITALMVFCLICMLYVTVGIGDSLARVTLLSYTTSERLMQVLGFASSILLLLECNEIVPIKLHEIRTDASLSGGIQLLNLSVISLLLWTAYVQVDLRNYIGLIPFICISIGLLLLGNLLFIGQKQPFLIGLTILTIFTGLSVNPINFGPSVLMDTPVAREIRRIDEQSAGRWLALDDFLLPKYVYAQGVDCINYLSWPPRFDLFEPLDEDGSDRDIYNRYAHVDVTLTESDTSFLLNQADCFSLHLSYEDLAKWDVKYIVTKKQLPLTTEFEGFQPIYYDTLDGINIYQVEYYHEPIPLPEGSASSDLNEFSLTIQITSDGEDMMITLPDSDYHNILFAVWSEVDGQDDLQWYQASRNEIGDWEYTVDVASHHSSGTYHIHAYDEEDGNPQMIVATDAEVLLSP